MLGIFPSDFPTRTLSSHPNMPHVFPPCRHPWFDHHHAVLEQAQGMQFAAPPPAPPPAPTPAPPPAPPSDPVSPNRVTLRYISPCNIPQRPTGGAEVYMYPVLTSALFGVAGQRHGPAILPLGKRHGAQRTGDWVGFGCSLDGYGKSRPHWGWNPGPSYL